MGLGAGASPFFHTQIGCLYRHSDEDIYQKDLDFQHKTIENFTRLERVALRRLPKEDLDKFFEVIMKTNKNVKEFEKEVKGADTD